MLEGLIWNKFVCSIFFSNKWSTNRIRVSLSKLLLPRECNIQNFILISHYKFSICTLRSQMEGSLLISIIFIHFSLPAVIWAYPFINFQENFQPLCFFSYTNEIFSIPPAVIRAYPLIKFEEKFQPTLLLEPPLILET